MDGIIFAVLSFLADAGSTSLDILTNLISLTSFRESGAKGYSSGTPTTMNSVIGFFSCVISIEAFGSASDAKLYLAKVKHGRVKICAGQPPYTACHKVLTRSHSKPPPPRV